MRYLRTVLMLVTAFASGAFVARLPQAAGAVPPAVSAATVDLGALAPSDFPAPNPQTPDLHSKLLVKVDATAFYYQAGLVPKHTHAGTTEVQLFLDGTGTEWLGDKQVTIKPGVVVIVPPNTPHGGLTGGPFRFYSVKTPPQDPADYHLTP